MTSPANRSLFAPAYPAPAMRRLRIYAFDPHASIELETALINDAVIELPWENRWEDPLEAGPVNDYLEVIDYDPACGLFYAPVDLNDRVLLAQNGLAPSEGRPQFHQQMVFAVAMRTIRIFERALGRPVMWARARPQGVSTAVHYAAPDSEFVKRLRIYPHALRQANAYYSPEKCSLLFGYFKKDGQEGRQDEGWVFTCLSQDIIAHETTHAILHGMQKRSIEPTSTDALAFHEGFADIVALLQHFSLSSVVEHELGRSRGSLRDTQLLNGLATQFGQATGRKGALRSALELIEKEQAAKELAANEEEREKQRKALPTMANTLEPHKRGQFLVAAVFDAFVTIYERRTADLMRLAGRAQDGAALSPDLVRRLATEARKAADHILRMCVRALDYIPPVDLQFGEYLRAIVTADADLVPNDPLCYRVAIAEAFRKRGIFVPGALSMAPDSLMWDELDPGDLPWFSNHPEEFDSLFASLLHRLKINVDFARRAKRDDTNPEGHEEGANPEPLNLRNESMRIILENQDAMARWLAEDDGHDIDWQLMLGLQIRKQIDYVDGTGAHQTATAMGGISISEKTGEPSIEVHSVRVARRQGPDGQELQQLVVQITQRRRAYFNPECQAIADETEKHAGKDPDTVIGKRRAALRELGASWDKPDFWFRGGATLLVDLRDGRLRRVIRKRIDKEARLTGERDYRNGGNGALGFALRDDDAPREPFAFIHGGLT